MFCDSTFQGHGAMWTTEKGDVHNKNEVSTRAIATSMGFRESRPSNVFFFLLGPPFFSLMDPWYFLAPTGASAVERKNTHWFRWEVGRLRFSIALALLLRLPSKARFWHLGLRGEAPATFDSCDILRSSVGIHQNLLVVSFPDQAINSLHWI